MRQRTSKETGVAVSGLRTATSACSSSLPVLKASDSQPTKAIINGKGDTYEHDLTPDTFAGMRFGSTQQEKRFCYWLAKQYSPIDYLAFFAELVLVSLRHFMRMSSLLAGCSTANTEQALSDHEFASYPCNGNFFQRAWWVQSRGLNFNLLRHFQQGDYCMLGYQILLITALLWMTFGRQSWNRWARPYMKAAIRVWAPPMGDAVTAALVPKERLLYTTPVYYSKYTNRQSVVFTAIKELTFGKVPLAIQIPLGLCEFLGSLSAAYIVDLKLYSVSQLSGATIILMFTFIFLVPTYITYTQERQLRARFLLHDANDDAANNDGSTIRSVSADHSDLDLLDRVMIALPIPPSPIVNGTPRPSLAGAAVTVAHDVADAAHMIGRTMTHAAAAVPRAISRSTSNASAYSLSRTTSRDVSTIPAQHAEPGKASGRRSADDSKGMNVASMQRGLPANTATASTSQKQSTTRIDRTISDPGRHMTARGQTSSILAQKASDVTDLSDVRPSADAPRMSSMNARDAAAHQIVPAPSLPASVVRRVAVDLREVVQHVLTEAEPVHQHNDASPPPEYKARCKLLTQSIKIRSHPTLVFEQASQEVLQHAATLPGWHSNPTGHHLHVFSRVCIPGCIQIIQVLTKQSQDLKGQDASTLFQTAEPAHHQGPIKIPAPANSHKRLSRGNYMAISPSDELCTYDTNLISADHSSSRDSSADYILCGEEEDWRMHLDERLTEMLQQEGTHTSAAVDALWSMVLPPVVEQNCSADVIIHVTQSDEKTVRQLHHPQIAGPLRAVVVTSNGKVVYDDQAEAVNATGIHRLTLPASAATGAGLIHIHLLPPHQQDTVAPPNESPILATLSVMCLPKAAAQELHNWFRSVVSVYRKQGRPIAPNALDTWKQHDPLAARLSDHHSSNIYEQVAYQQHLLPLFADMGMILQLGNHVAANTADEPGTAAQATDDYTTNTPAIANTNSTGTCTPEVSGGAIQKSSTPPAAAAYAIPPATAGQDRLSINSSITSAQPPLQQMKQIMADISTSLLAYLCQLHLWHCAETVLHTLQTAGIQLIDRTDGEQQDVSKAMDKLKQSLLQKPTTAPTEVRGHAQVSEVQSAGNTFFMDAPRPTILDRLHSASERHTGWWASPKQLARATGHMNSLTSSKQISTVVGKYKMMHAVRLLWVWLKRRMDSLYIKIKQWFVRIIWPQDAEALTVSHEFGCASEHVKNE